MNNFWDLLKENSFVGALASGVLLIFVGWIISHLRKRYRANRLYNLFKKELKERQKDFLSVHLLSSVTGYTENDVEILCSFHSKITRNENEKRSWRLNNK